MYRLLYPFEISLIEDIVLYEEFAVSAHFLWHLIGHLKILLKNKKCAAEAAHEKCRASIAATQSFDKLDKPKDAK